MERLRLKKDIVMQIQNDPILFGKIAFALNLKPSSLPQLLYNNHINLTQFSSIKIIREHLGLPEEDILETIPEETTTS
ncbi:MAG TPA: hypothetical protein VG847_00965 [Chitinophagaceae bacterium]|nr:hypothetical protein [Chitinophagaceae bacterium]